MSALARRRRARSLRKRNGFSLDKGVVVAVLSMLAAYIIGRVTGHVSGIAEGKALVKDATPRVLGDDDTLKEGTPAFTASSAGEAGFLYLDNSPVGIIPAAPKIVRVAVKNGGTYTAKVKYPSGKESDSIQVEARSPIQRELNSPYPVLYSFIPK